MVIDPTSAADFIAGYKSLLLTLHQMAGAIPSELLLENLTAGRERIKLNPVFVDEAAAALEAEGRAIPADVLRGIKTLRLRRWVFLRDTTRYSIFIDSEAREAYAVLGLTQRIRDIFGGSALTFEAGVVEFRGRYVCDGLAANHLWLGPNYQKDFSALFAELKKAGRFYIRASPHRARRSTSG